MKGALNSAMIDRAIPLEDGWRIIGRYNDWGQADAVRLGIWRDSPKLECRIRFLAARYVIEVKGE